MVYRKTNFEVELWGCEQHRARRETWRSNTSSRVLQSIFR